MKSVILLGTVALLGYVALPSEAPASSRPIVPTHAPSNASAMQALPTAVRNAEMHAPLVISAGASLIFHRYVCTIDCSGHEAGYEWAEENGIDDPDDCGGNSESFIEGCRAYAEERGADAADEDEDDEGGR